MKILNNSELENQINNYITNHFEGNIPISFIELLREFLPNRAELIKQFTNSILLKNRNKYKNKQHLLNKDLLLPLARFEDEIRKIINQPSKIPEVKTEPIFKESFSSLPGKVINIDHYYAPKSDEPTFGNPKHNGSTFVPDIDFDEFMENEGNEKDITEMDADELLEKIKKESDENLKNIIEAKKIDRDLYEQSLIMATKKIMASGKMEHQIKILAELRSYLEKTNTFSNTKDASMLLGDEEISQIEHLESIYKIPSRTKVK